jgi:hypothetical protein
MDGASTASRTADAIAIHAVRVTSAVATTLRHPRQRRPDPSRFRARIIMM